MTNESKHIPPVEQRVVVAADAYFDCALGQIFVTWTFSHYASA